MSLRRGSDTGDATAGRGTVVRARPPLLMSPTSPSCYGTVPPTGVACAAAALRESGQRVPVVDAAGEVPDQVTRGASPVGKLRMTGLSPRDIIIVGLPQEGRRDLWRSWRFLFDALGAGCHSRLLALARTGPRARTFTPRTSTAELLLMRNLMLLSFYGASYLTRLSRTLRPRRSLRSGLEETRVDRFIRTTLGQRRRRVIASAGGASR